MWLMDVKTYELKYFIGEDIRSKSPYAVLSHTWGEDEVTFEDMKDLKKARQKAGFSKISETCRLAETERLSHAWVDTCCIDKSSSAELQEAINSMSKWYSNANVCYAYLSDVDEPGNLSQSRWFTRGWTLKELLMPEDVRFFGSKWQFLGTKFDMRHAIPRLTGIDIEVLNMSDITMRLGSFSVAKRMSWAAKRRTTRLEDRAYSLLGIFNVSMPLLYGEGAHAFRRLQEEIFRTTADLSLFLWQFDTQARPPLIIDYDRDQCLLAPFPDVFENCRHIKTSTSSPSRAATRNLSSIGLMAKLSVLTRHSQSNPLYGAGRLLLLDCYDERYPQYTIALRTFVKENLFCAPPCSQGISERRRYIPRLESVDAIQVLEQAHEEDVILLRSEKYVSIRGLNYITKYIWHHDSKAPACYRAEAGIDHI